MSHQSDNYTKPSRLKRKRKKSWKRKTAKLVGLPGGANLPHPAKDKPNPKASVGLQLPTYPSEVVNLTDNSEVAMLFIAGTSSTGRGNLVKLWRKVAATYSGFFMPVIQRGLAPFAFCYGGLFWAAFGAGWLHNPVFHPIAARRPMPWKASAAVQSSVMEQPL